MARRLRGLETWAFTRLRALKTLHLLVVVELRYDERFHAPSIWRLADGGRNSRRFTVW